MLRTQEDGPAVRKLIAFDDDTFDKLKQLGARPDGDHSGIGG